MGPESLGLEEEGLARAVFSVERWMSAVTVIGEVGFLVSVWLRVLSDCGNTLVIACWGGRDRDLSK
jgi:hypothetical protein